MRALARPAACRAICAAAPASGPSSGGRGRAALVKARFWASGGGIGAESPQGSPPSAPSDGVDLPVDAGGFRAMFLPLEIAVAAARNAVILTLPTRRSEPHRASSCLMRPRPAVQLGRGNVRLDALPFPAERPPGGGAARRVRQNRCPDHPLWGGRRLAHSPVRRGGPTSWSAGWRSCAIRTALRIGSPLRNVSTRLVVLALIDPEVQPLFSVGLACEVYTCPGPCSTRRPGLISLSATYPTRGLVPSQPPGTTSIARGRRGLVAPQPVV